MASTSLGRLYVDLLMKTGSFETDAGRAAKIAEKRAREIDRAFSGAMTNVKNNIIGVGVALVGINSVVALAQKGFAGLIASIDNADKINELSARLGRTAEEISAIGYAAKQSGTDLESIGAAIPKLSKKIAEAADENSEAAKLFRALGVEIKDSVTGEVEDALEVLPDLQDRFKALTNDTEKQALSMELLGKSGAGMIEFLSLGADGMKALTDRAAELGITISGETAAGADAFNDKLSELRAVSEGLTAQVAAELLPKLIELVDWAVQFTADGDNARDIADRLGASFGLLADTATIVADVFNVMGTAIGGALAQASGMFEVASGLVSLDWGRIKFGASLFGEGQKATVNAAVFGTDNSGGSLVNFGRARMPQAPNGAGIDFSRGAPVSHGDKALEERVSRYFSGGGAKASGGKAGKPALTEEQKRAEELQRAYESLQVQQLERIAAMQEEARTGQKVGEAWQIAYDIQNGGLKGLLPQKAEELIANAEKLDQMEVEAELQKALDEKAKEQIERFDDVVKGLQEEAAAYGMTNEELRTRNALKEAGVELDTAQGQAIAGLVQQVGDAERMADVLDNARGIAYDFLIDLPKGAEGAWKNALASIESMLLQWAAKGIIEQVFGQSGTTGKGSMFGDMLGGLFGGGAGGEGGGFNWGGLFSSFFGGGRANGGPVAGGKMYEVNERGMPELLNVGSKQLLMMPAGQGGRVTPMRTGGGSSMVNNFYLSAPTEHRTQQQIAGKLEYTQKRAAARNS